MRHHIRACFGALRLLGPPKGNGREVYSADTSVQTNRISAAPIGCLSQWDVVDTVTLCAIKGD